MVALQLKDLDSKNECAQEERALQRAEEAVSQQNVQMKQWTTEAAEMNAQMKAINQSTHVSTLQEPIFGALTPVSAGMNNYKLLNKSAKKLIAAAATSKKNAKDLEKAGSDQMANVRNGLTMLII